MDWYIFGSLPGVNSLLKKLYNFVVPMREPLIYQGLGGGQIPFGRAAIEP